MKKTGFSYIEILIAVSISAVIFTTIFPLLYSSMEKNRNNKLKLVAYEAASNQIEELRTRKVSSLLAPSHITFEVTEIPDSTGDVFIEKKLGDEKIASVLITVTWKFKNNTENVSLSSYLYGSTE